MDCICLHSGNGFVVNAQDFSAAFNKADVKKVMRSVADWQIAHQPEVKHQPLGWENAAMYMGMLVGRN